LDEGQWCYAFNNSGQNYTSVFGTVVDKNLFEDLQEHAPKAAHNLKGAKGLVPVLLETEPATVTVSVH
jgi:hypothetical protein